MKSKSDTENKSPKNAVRRFALRMPHFSDPGQRKTGGYIASFIAGLLVLTLIARGTSAATLARVELKNPVRSEIVEAVKGSANVAVCDTQDVFAPEGLTISEIMVGQGQKVAVGDALARFDMDEVSDKLARESASLNKLRLDLEKLEREDLADTTSLESAQRSLLRAQEDYAAVLAQCEADVAAAQKTLEEAWASPAESPDAASLDAARKTLQRAWEDYNAVLAQGNEDIAAAERALSEAINNPPEASDTTSLGSAQRTLDRAREDYNNATTQCDAEVAAALSDRKSTRLNSSH